MLQFEKKCFAFKWVCRLKNRYDKWNLITKRFPFWIEVLMERDRERQRTKFFFPPFPQSSLIILLGNDWSSIKNSSLFFSLKICIESDVDTSENPFSSSSRRNYPSFKTLMLTKKKKFSSSHFNHRSSSSFVTLEKKKKKKKNWRRSSSNYSCFFHMEEKLVLECVNFSSQFDLDV